MMLLPYSSSFQNISIALFICLVYWKSIFESDFVYDDRAAILSNDDVLGHTEWSAILRHDFWGNPISNRGSHKSYRPLITATYRLQATWHGLRPSLFHVVNVIIHVANSLLVRRLANQLGYDQNTSLLSTLLFALHPICTESVSSIVGRADLLAATCLLLALTTTWTTLGLATIGLLAKETAIVIVPLVLIRRHHCRQKVKWRRILEYSTFLVIACVARLAVNNFESPRFSESDNPIAHDPSLLTRTLTLVYLPVFHFSLIVFPKTLCFDWSIPLVRSIFDIRVPISVLFYTVLIGVLIRVIRSNSAATHQFLLSLLILPHLISSNLFTYVGFQAAERILYMPTISAALLVGDTWQRMPRPLLVALIVVLAARSAQRVEDWTTEEKLFKSALEISPVRANANLGHFYAARNELDKAKTHYFEALRHKPNMADTWYNLGVLTSKTNTNKSEAILYYEQALKFRKNFAAAHLNLAIILDETRQSTLTNIFRHLDECIQASGEHSKAYQNHRKIVATCAFNKGRILRKIGRIDEAIEAFEMTLHLATPSFEHLASTLTSLGACHSSRNEPHLADQYFQHSLRIDSHHINTLLTWAQHHLHHNNTNEARRLLAHAHQLAPTSPLVLHHLARISRDSAQSLRLYRDALAIDGRHVASLRGIADVLREMRRFDEAETYYREVCRVEGETAETLTNLGAIYHLNGKFAQALDAYNRALRISPNDSVAMANRQKLMRVMRRVDHNNTAA